MTTLAATPAYAVDFACKYQDKTFATPGDNTYVEIQLCIQRVGDGYEATADVSWFNGGTSSIDGERKFDKFDVQVRVEQSNVVKGSRTCDIRYDINSFPRSSELCSKFVTHDRTSTWTADGKVVFDLDRDGEGAYTWDLTGSPQID
ncbi:hypothetical protein G5C60_31075 [Streptomyces sp. HC44]|uniref:Uncharacterized protein n=1 Tax=Streptomyces scabichelini TaxID=2711217 RepID=A0A6G4VDP2_9ACTN|nr:hypothetical protein [Streptomyces scabichelini]NGO11927.1 hypothetical protein [Streptomyces scabichelini]